MNREEEGKGGNMNRRGGRIEYEQRIKDIELPSLIFTATEGIGDSTTQVYKASANLLSTKHSVPYCVVMDLLYISFSLLNVNIMCICDVRSSLGCPVAKAPITVWSQKHHIQSFFYQIII